MNTVLINHERIDTSITGAVAYRIRYTSHDVQGKLTESTGLVIAPAAASENRKVLSWAHGTTGIGDACCPSAQLDPARELVTYFQSNSPTEIDYGVPGLQKFIDDDWVVVATDYQGLGTPGMHQYTVNITNAIDAVMIVHAAREMSVGAGTKFGVIGWSQGGGTAAAAAELDATIYGELELVGTVAQSPGIPSMALKVPGMGTALASGNVPADGHLVMILAGMATAWPETLSWDDMFTPVGKKFIDENWNTQPNHHFTDILVRTAKHEGPINEIQKDKLPAWVKAFTDSSAGQKKPVCPVLVQIDAQYDGPCPRNWQDAYIETVTAFGGDVSFTAYDNDDHFSLPQSAIGEAHAWLTAKF